MKSKQKDTDLITDFIEINGRQATTVKGAQQILTELASELGRPRDYSRFTVYRMLTNHHIEAIRTPSANYYYVDDLRNLKDKLHPERGTHQNIPHYPLEKKTEAIQLYQQGVSNREISRRIKVSYQTVNNWIKKHKQISFTPENS